MIGRQNLDLTGFAVTNTPFFVPASEPCLDFAAVSFSLSSNFAALNSIVIDALYTIPEPIACIFCGIKDIDWYTWLTTIHGICNFAIGVAHTLNIAFVSLAFVKSAFCEPDNVSSRSFSDVKLPKESNTIITLSCCPNLSCCSCNLSHKFAINWLVSIIVLTFFIIIFVGSTPRRLTKSESIAPSESR